MAKTKVDRSGSLGPSSVILPGLDGVPFRQRQGQPLPFLKESDEQRPRLNLDVEARVFDMGIPSDVKAYNAVFSEIGKGSALLSKEESHWCDETQSFKIFLRWAKPILEMPQETTDHEQDQARTIR